MKNFSSLKVLKVEKLKFEKKMKRARHNRKGPCETCAEISQFANEKQEVVREKKIKKCDPVNNQPDIGESKEEVGKKCLFRRSM